MLELHLLLGLGKPELLQWLRGERLPRVTAVACATAEGFNNGKKSQLSSLPGRGCLVILWREFLAAKIA
jgi:hypothetical protein